MKKILASLFVTSVAICSASAANAQSTISDVSIHRGTVPASCRFDASLAGSLTATPVPVTLNLNTAGTSLSSIANPGRFTVICNSNHSFAAVLETGRRPSTIDVANYSERFRFLGAVEPYDRINTSDFAATFATVTNLPATPRAGYVVQVAAEARLVDGGILPASSVNGYEINIQATVTPG
jgi:hypothetical protein